MMKILVAVDGSEHSLNAVRHVIGLTKQKAAVSPHLLSVYYEPVRYGDVGTRPTKAQMKELEARDDPGLRKAETMLREAGIEFEREIAAGDVPDTIARRAEELGCDAIVMGTSGAGALANLVIGSVANKVVHLSKLPVTLVK